jgi:hypothetical protein
LRSQLDVELAVEGELRGVRRSGSGEIRGDEQRKMTEAERQRKAFSSENSGSRPPPRLVPRTWGLIWAAEGRPGSAMTAA